MVSCLPDESPVALAWAAGRLGRGLLTRLGLGDVSLILAVAGTSARLWIAVSGEGISNRVSFPGASCRIERVLGLEILNRPESWGGLVSA